MPTSIFSPMVDVQEIGGELRIIEDGSLREEAVREFIEENWSIILEEKEQETKE